MSAQLSISTGNLEPEELDRLSRDLERQLTETGGVALGAVPHPTAPGQRGDPITVGTLLLAAVTSDTVSALFNIIKSYVDRGIDLNFEGTGTDGSSAIPSFFVAANLQPQIRILIPRYSPCESCGTGFCVTIIADEGVSFQKKRFRSLDLTLKGKKVPKSGHF